MLTLEVPDTRVRQERQSSVANQFGSPAVRVAVGRQDPIRAPIMLQKAKWAWAETVQER